jgi:uncharacterized protein VirK/YbjX
MTFSIFDKCVFIGGIQGRSSEDALERYRQITRDFNGVRPRDLLIIFLQYLLPALGATQIHAVADKYRYFRHPFFHNTPETEALFNYDEIWKDRGGWQIDDTHYALPTMPARRSIDDVPSKKKNMYRRRYNMLDDLEQQLHVCGNSAQVCKFDAT